MRRLDGVGGSLSTNVTYAIIVLQYLVSLQPLVNGRDTVVQLTISPSQPFVLVKPLSMIPAC